MPEQPTHTFFNSRCAEYKTPFGAVPAGQTVTWRLTVPERLGYVDPHLVLTKDREDPVHYRMDFDGQTPGVNHFVFQLAPTTSGLYFYHFDLYTDFRKIYRTANGEGELTWVNGLDWQLTVYDFNSRPSARGDARTRRLSCGLRISIHAPPRGATYEAQATYAQSIFQFTPLREGRPALARRQRISATYFNSRPSARGDVSRKWFSLPVLLFQFTPLREGRLGQNAEERRGTYFNSRPSARGDGKRYAISANLLFNPYKSAWLNNSATQFVEIILVIFHRIIA